MKRITLVLALFLLLPSVARADGGPASPSLPEEPTSAATLPSVASEVTVETARQSYGWQPFIADVASVGTFAAGLAVGHGVGAVATEYVGCSGFLLASPSIHLAHGHSGKAVLALALRALLPVALGMAGYAVGGPGSPHAGEAGAPAIFQGFGGLLGVGTGALIAAGLDDLVLAQEDVRAPAPVGTRRTIEPRISAVAQGATLGIGGTF